MGKKIDTRSQQGMAEIVRCVNRTAAQIKDAPLRVSGWRGSSLLNTDQAAIHLNLAKTTLEAMRVRGGGPLFIRLGRAVRYRPEDLDTWIGARVHSSTSSPGS